MRIDQEKKNRRWVVIRKQKPDPKKPEKELRWIAACQHCGRACMAADWTVVLAWGSVHRSHCSVVPLPGFVKLDPFYAPNGPFFEGPAMFRQRMMGRI